MLNDVNEHKIQGGQTKKSLIELYTDIQILKKQVASKLIEIEEEE